MKYIIGLVAMLLPLLSGAQSSSVKPVRIGERVPDIVFENLVNHKTPTAKLSDFKGKVLILDFWATWCSSCIAHFPEQDSLQKLYKDKLQVILVNTKGTRDTKQTIQNFLNKRVSNAKVFSLPSVVGDTVLEKLFPHRFLPHYIWINASGILSAITGPEAFTVANINTLYNLGKIDIYPKADAMDYDPMKPLIQDGNGGSGNKLLFSSTLTSYLEGLGSGARINDDGITKKICYLNRPILSLYQSALGIDINRMLVLSKDSSRFFETNRTNNLWKNNNFYCYEYTVPISASENDRSSDMVNDLNNRLRLSGRMEKRMVPCYVLIRSSDNTQSRVVERECQVKINSGKPIIELRNKPLSKLLQLWNDVLPPDLPTAIFLDETGHEGNVNIQLYSTVNDLPALKKELNTYGFDLIPAIRELNMFVLRDLNK